MGFVERYRPGTIDTRRCACAKLSDTLNDAAMPYTEENKNNPEALSLRALGVFRAALDLPESQRREWVQAQCADDPTLLGRVVRLLEADAQAGGLLPTGGSADVNLDPAPQRVGPYRITDVLGLGGMGIVYRGEREDGVFERTVAIKFVQVQHERFAFRERFDRERALLATMQHKNIAQLLDGGEHQGQPYLVMEYVDGVPLAPDPSRSLEATLRIFLDVCSAVSYAHNQLVLHRDIKLDNILLNTEGDPKLLDFGVAKFVDGEQSTDNDLTQAFARPMTLAYAAPEYLRGEASSIATEVYALGVCLYTLCNGQRPYELAGMTAFAAYEKLAETTVHSQCGNADMDAIIERAMRFEADQRYASVRELAEDIRRHLGNEAVLARSGDRRYRLVRFLSRYRVYVATGAIVMLSLITALVISFASYLRAENERLTTEATVSFMNDTLVGANPWEGPEVEQDIGALLQQAEQRLAETYRDRPDIQHRILLNLSDIYIGRSEFDSALRTANAAMRLLEQHPQALAESRADTWRVTGAALQESGDFAAARAALTRAIEGFQPLNRDNAGVVSGIQNRLGTVLMDLQAGTEAEQAFLTALALHEQFPVNDPEQRSAIHNNLGALYRYRGEHERALEHLQAVNTLLTQFEAGPMRRAMTLSNIGNVHASLGRMKASEEALLAAIALLEPELPQHHPELLQMRASLASVYTQTDAWRAAIDTLQPALAARTQLDPALFVYSYIEHIAGLAYCGAGDPVTGLPMAERAMQARAAMFGDEHWLVASAAGVVGMCFTASGEFKSAVQTLEPAVEKLRSVRGEEDSLVRTNLARLEAARRGLATSVNQ